MLRIGQVIDRYQVEALIGQGGMAAVYRARHAQLDSQHAVKVLFITAPQIRERLLREGKVQANLRHTNIVSVTDVLEVQGAPALVMEYVDGPALDDWLQKNTPTIDEALFLFRGILLGVSAAHDRGVVHRDLKPANILLSRTNEGIVPKVTDFGLVKSVRETQGSHTQTGMALGTPEYMSPEQIRDASDVDQRADMFALGCILYELTTGQRAFARPDKMSTFNAIVAGDYEPPRNKVPELPDKVVEAIGGLLQVDRDARMKNCADLYDLLYEDQTVGRLGPPSRPASMLEIDPANDLKERFGASPMPAQRTSMPEQSALATAPTGVPAAQRNSAPTALRRDTPVHIPSLDEAGRGGPINARTVTMGFLLALFVGVGTGVVVMNTLGAEEVDPPRPVALPSPPPSPVVPAAVQPAPAPLPEPEVEPEPVTAPKPPPRPTPSPPPRPTPTPKPVVPAPVPTPPPAPAPTATSGATVRVTGDAASVVLVAAGKRFQPGGGRLASGTYQIFADFGGGSEVNAGKVRLDDGQTATIDCSSFLYKCQAK